MFGVSLPGGNAVGHDIDTTGVELDGVDYGKIEVRTRSMREHTQRQIYSSTRDPWETTYEYTRLRADFLTTVDMKRKKDNPADWFFCALYDPEVKELVWFRFPANLVFSKSSLTVTKSTDGGYGWADSYLWVGPENEL
jgi:hypothetical protein